MASRWALTCGEVGSCRLGIRACSFERRKIQSCIWAIPVVSAVRVVGCCWIDSGNCISISWKEHPTMKFKVGSITTRWPGRCRRVCRKQRIFPANRSLCWMITGRMCQRPALSRQTVCRPADWLNAACDSSSCIIRTGIITADFPERCRQFAKKQTGRPQHW